MEDGGPADHTKPSSLEDPAIVFDSEAEARAVLEGYLRRGVPDWVVASRFRRLDDGRLTWRSDIAGRVRWAAEGGEPLIPGLWPYVEEMRCPTLVVRGSESSLFRADYAQRMTEINTNIRLTTIADAGHLVHCAQPGAFSRGRAGIPRRPSMTTESLETLLLSYRDGEAGGKVVDYVGADVPRELIEAAGFVPRRLRATSPPTRLAEEILGPGVDPTARRVLAGLLDPALEHGELLVLCHDTDSTVRLYTSLRALVRERYGPALPELYFLDLLHLPTDTTARYNLQRVRDLLAALEHRAGREVAEAGLRQAIAETNESRRLLLRLQALRRASPPLLGGADALAVIGAWSALPSKRFNELLRAVLDAAPGFEPRPGTRVYLTGSGHHSPELYRGIEERGAIVVGEDHDWGEALADGLVDEAAPPLEALTARYHVGSALGRRHSADERAAFAAAQAEAARADVVVAWIRAGDDALAWDVPAQRRSLAARGIPFVVLDRRGDDLSDLDGALTVAKPT